MYRVKKAWLLLCGWVHSGWGEHCHYGHRAQVLRDGKEVGGIVVIDARSGPTVILCDDGVVQRGGVWRPVRSSC